jgi:hypothetical protein|tara:strand:- start:1057 stop:1203 length:147 start_codon:yes stop_codon:yes gene_type:complete
MAKRIKLISPDGQTEIEFNEGETDYLIEKGWKTVELKKIVSAKKKEDK